MDGGDNMHPLRATDATASLNDELQEVELTLDIVVPEHGVAHFTSHLVGDGKIDGNHEPYGWQKMFMLR